MVPPVVYARALTTEPSRVKVVELVTVTVQEPLAAVAPLTPLILTRSPVVKAGAGGVAGGEAVGRRRRDGDGRRGGDVSDGLGDGAGGAQGGGDRAQVTEVAQGVVEADVGVVGADDVARRGVGRQDASRRGGVEAGVD